MAAPSRETEREACSPDSIADGSRYDLNESRSYTTKGERLEPVQFAEFPVEIKELIYEQAMYLDQPLSGTICADFLPRNRRSGRNLLSCLSAVCFTNKHERVIASRVFIRNLVFRIWSPECNLNLRRFFDTLPENVGYSSATEFRICCSYAVNDPAWSWEHERPLLDVKLISSCPNLRTLTFAFRLHERPSLEPSSHIDRLPSSFQYVLDCKDLKTINLELFSSKNNRLKETGLSIFMGLAKWLQESFLRRNGTKLVVKIDWNIKDRWFYTWRTSWDVGGLSHSLVQQRYVNSPNQSGPYAVKIPDGEAVELLRLSLDDAPIEFEPTHNTDATYPITE